MYSYRAAAARSPEVRRECQPCPSSQQILATSLLHNSQSINQSINHFIVIRH